MPSSGQTVSATSRASSNFAVHTTPAYLLAEHSIEAALEKRAHEVAVIDMREVSTIADFFVICTGQSDLQLKAIKNAVVERLEEECEETPWHIEGEEHLKWIVLDYVDTVVHLFAPEQRSFYDLERLWGDAPIEYVSDGDDEIELLKQAAAGAAEDE
jgi:ribosome-associated protein